MRAAILAVVALVAVATSAVAQPLSLQFREGRVSLNATNVPVRTILAEWARLGGTEVVGADKISGAPVTLQLEDLPEARALEIILRSVAGYMAAPRRAGTSGASAYDRILVLATSSAPAAPPPAARAGGGPGMAAPAFRPPQAPAFDPQPSVDDPDAVNEPAPFSFPQQNPFQPVGQPGAFGTPMVPGQGFSPFGQGTGITVNPSPQQAIPVLQFPGTPAPGGAAPPPGGGFGVISAPMPGVVVQPAPPPGTRPPGGM
jgi:hypothetical protein